MYIYMQNIKSLKRTDIIYIRSVIDACSVNIVCFIITCNYVAIICDYITIASDNIAITSDYIVKTYNYIIFIYSDYIYHIVKYITCNIILHAIVIN